MTKISMSATFLPFLRVSMSVASTNIRRFVARHDSFDSVVKVFRSQDDTVILFPLHKLTFPNF